MHQLSTIMNQSLLLCIKIFHLKTDLERISTGQAKLSYHSFYIPPDSFELTNWNTQSGRNPSLCWFLNNYWTSCHLAIYMYLVFNSLSSVNCKLASVYNSMSRQYFLFLATSSATNINVMLPIISNWNVKYLTFMAELK